MQPNTPPQVPLRYGTETKPAMAEFELKHMDFSTVGLFGDHDTTDPETPSLGTEASFMTEDGMQGLLSHQTSRETTIF